MIQHSSYQNPDWYQTGLWEYMLLVNPNKSIGEKVMAEKEYFGNKYGAEIATKSLPHITIGNFLLKERMEDLFCKRLQNICHLQYGFPVMLNNFSGFPAHAIFIRVQNPKPFKELAKNLKRLDEFLKTNDCPPSQLVTSPHMTIARRLDEQTYNKGIIEYAQRDFSEVFVVNQLTLLKKDSRYKKWQHVTHLHLPVVRNVFN